MEENHLADHLVGFHLGPITDPINYYGSRRVNILLQKCSGRVLEKDCFAARQINENNAAAVEKDRIAAINSDNDNSPALNN